MQWRKKFVNRKHCSQQVREEEDWETRQNQKNEDLEFMNELMYRYKNASFMDTEVCVYGLVSWNEWWVTFRTCDGNDLGGQGKDLRN